MSYKRFDLQSKYAAGDASAANELSQESFQLRRLGVIEGAESQMKKQSNRLRLSARQTPNAKRQTLNVERQTANAER
jgi:hypothetical protein